MQKDDIFGAGKTIILADDEAEICGTERATDPDRPLDDIRHDRVGLEPSSVLFEPLDANTEMMTSRDLLSPVMGTEALYTQAGWVTSKEHDQTHPPNNKGLPKWSQSEAGKSDFDIAESSAASDVKEVNSELIIRRSLATSQNQGTDSPLALTVDGITITNEARTSPLTMFAANSLGENIETLICDDDDGIDDDEPLQQQSDKESNEADHHDNFPIPTSIREIYNISNRNRLKKHVGSSPIELSAKERVELEKAEAILKERGLLNNKAFQEFFDASSNLPTSSGRESEEDLPYAGTIQDDLSFMKEIGWIQDDSDLNSLLDFQAQNSSERRADAGTSTSEISGGSDHYPNESQSDSARESPTKGGNSLSSF
jgi:hypothetical protein